MPFLSSVRTSFVRPVTLTLLAVVAATTLVSAPASAETEMVRLVVKQAPGDQLEVPVGSRVAGSKRADDALAKLGWTEIEVPAGKAAAIERRLLATGGASEVEAPVEVRMASTPNDPYYSYQWEHRITTTDSAWDKPLPKSVTIAILDTGVNSGGDLTGRVLPGASMVPLEPGTVDTDEHQHGTLAAHVAAGAGNNGVGVAGVCWDCKILPVRVLATTGPSLSTYTAAGIVWAADNGADVINLSLSGEGASPQVVTDAVVYALGKGIPVVASAGNEGLTAPRWPASQAGVISVGGTDTKDNMYSWSNRGSWVSLTAPGVVHVSLDGFSLQAFTGTSAAAPHVAGAVALRKATGQFGQETPAQTKSALMTTSAAIGDPTGAAAGRIAVGRIVPLTDPGPPTAILDARYNPLTPTRILDTRYGTGAATAMLGPGETMVVKVAGAGGVPATGASAAVLNVTVTEGNDASFLSVYPHGVVRPNASSLNFLAGQDIPNLVTTQLGSNGFAAIFNAAGYVHVIADVQGYFGSGGSSGSAYTPLSPARVLDTRFGNGVPQAGALGAGKSLDLQVTGRGQVPADGSVQAVAINVTAAEVSAASYLTVWPTGVARPVASNLNLVAGRDVPNMVVVPVSSTGKISIFNANGTVAVIADVVGYYSATGSSTFTPLSPSRVLDTRFAHGAPGAVVAGAPVAVSISGQSGVPAGAKGVVLNVTSTEASNFSYLALWPAGEAEPIASNLNFRPGQTIANLVIAKLSPDGRVMVLNASGATHVLADVVGYLR